MFYANDEVKDYIVTTDALTSGDDSANVLKEINVSSLAAIKSSTTELQTVTFTPALPPLSVFPSYLTEYAKSSTANYAVRFGILQWNGISATKPTTFLTYKTAHMTSPIDYDRYVYTATSDCVWTVADDGSKLRRTYVALISSKSDPHNFLILSGAHYNNVVGTSTSLPVALVANTVGHPLRSINVIGTTVSEMETRFASALTIPSDVINTYVVRLLDAHGSVQNPFA